MAGESFSLQATNVLPSGETDAVLTERIRAALEERGFKVDVIWREG